MTEPGWSRDYILCLNRRLFNNWDKDGAGIIYFVLTVDCLMIGTRMEQGLYTLSKQ